MLAMMLPLAACGVGGFTMAQADVDRSIVTSSVQPDAPAARTETASDQATIRNAVSSADVEGLAGRAIPWANSDTGSRGTITGVAEYRDRGQLCRRFTTSRESFDGVAMYKGEACLASAGDWSLQDFTAL
jgi:surface antigen